MTGEMAPAERGDAPVPAGLRASHDDRDHAVELLRVAAGDGRLSAEELDERLELALTARTVGELAVLTQDLPAVPGRTAAPAPRPKEISRIDISSGSTRRVGRWVVPQRLDVRVSSGSVRLDLTEAVLTQPTLVINAEVASGSLRIITRPGIVVDTDDVTVRSGSARVRAPWGPDVPVILRVEVSGKVGSGSISARPQRRTFLQWLMRRPMPYQLARP